MKQDTLTTTQAGRILGRDQSTLYRMAKAGRLPARHVGKGKGHWVFERAVIEVVARTGEVPTVC